MRDRLVRLLGEADTAHGGGSITDELRRYARHLHNVWYDPRGNMYTYTTMDVAPSSDAVRLDEHVLAIADRIDAEHDKALNIVDDAYDAGYNVGYDVGFAYADDWCAQHEDAMAEHGWYRAVDMYEKPVLIGDMMQGMRAGGGWCGPFEVVRIDFNGHDWVAYEDAKTGHLLSKCRHYHAPTVEDVLREFFSRYVTTKPKDEDDAIIAEYAAKLRLVGDAE